VRLEYEDNARAAKKLRRDLLLSFRIVGKKKTQAAGVFRLHAIDPQVPGSPRIPLLFATPAGIFARK
jgi:hypothetical protein